MIELSTLLQRLQERIPIQADNIREARDTEASFPQGIFSGTSRENACFIEIGYYAARAPAVSLEETLSGCFGADTTLNVNYTVIIYAPSSDFLWLWKQVYNALNGWWPEDVDTSVKDNSVQYFQGQLLSVANGIYRWVDEYRLDIFEITD